MASGTPFLTTDLAGIPPEYKDYLFIIKNNSVEEIAAGLECALTLTDNERETFGARAREFVLNQKNKTVQARKFAELLDKLK